MKKILLPIALPLASGAVADEVAFLARRFKAQIVLLHVVAPPGHVPGMPLHGDELTGSDRKVNAIELAQEALDSTLLQEFSDLDVRRLLHKGDVAREIVRTALAEEVDLIALATRGEGMLHSFLSGSTAARVLHQAGCPVLTDTRRQARPAFTINRVLCAVELSPHSRATVAGAARLAADLGARLTLVHVTAAAQTWGPGGSYANQALKKTLIDYATQELDKLQQALPVAAEVIVESGNVRERLRIVAEHRESDLLVLGRKPPGGHLGDNGGGYSIIRDARIPVLSL